MKKILIIGLVLWRTMCCHAQTQELEQLKLNLEKLAQLKLMLSQAKQGYQTLQNGYNAVRDAAKGNYDLQKNYLDVLLQVSPQVKNAPALKRILGNSALIQKEYQQWYNQVQYLGLFKQQELTDISQSYQLIASGISDQLDQLQTLITPGKFRMSDGERVSVIEKIATQSDERIVALRQMMKDQTSIAEGRAKNKKDIAAIRRLYGIH